MYHLWPNKQKIVTAFYSSKWNVQQEGPLQLSKQKRVNIFTLYSLFKEWILEKSEIWN